jgi:hypothetical protein
MRDAVQSLESKIINNIVRSEWGQVGDLPQFTVFFPL